MTSKGYLNQPIKILMCLGVWKINSSKFPQLKRLSSVYSFFMGIILFSQAILIISNAFSMLGDSSKLAPLIRSTTFGIVMGVMSIKALLLHIFEDKTRECIQAIEKFSKTSIYLNDAKKTQDAHAKVSKIMLRLIIMAVHIYLLRSYFEKILSYFMGTTSEKYLPVDIYFPVDVTQSPYFEIMYFYEVITVSSQCYLMYALDMTFSGILMMAASFVRSVRIHLAKLATEEVETSVAEKRAFFLNVVKEVVKVTQIIRDVEEVFSLIGLAQFFHSLIIISCGIYMVNLPFGTLDTLVMYMIVSYGILQLLLYCYFGQEIATEITKLRDGFYADTLWYNDMKGYKDGIMLSLMICEKELYISAGGLANFSRETFTDVMKAAFSFYQFLNNF